jgi:phage-related protein
MMQLGKAFPEGLGPWALVPAPELSISLDLQKSTWSATEPKAEIAKLKQFSWEATGSISPVAAITLPGAIRKALNIPMGATKFLWAHPNPNEHTFTDQQFGYMSLTTPSAAFFMFGGFVYLHESNVVQAVMALALGEGLSFEAPAKWRSEYTAALKGRWKAVTAPFLKAKGAKKFAWINPCETLQGSAGDWQVAQHGAFVYSFHEDEAQTDSKDVYFEVAGASSVGRVPTGAIGKYVKSLPKAAWEPGPTGNDSKKPAAEKDKQKDTEKTTGAAGGTRFCCVQ